MENFTIRGMSIYVGCLLQNIFFFPPLATDKAEHVGKGYGFSCAAGLIFCQNGVYSSGTCKQGSESAACWVGTQLRQRRIECVVNFKVL